MAITTKPTAGNQLNFTHGIDSNSTSGTFSFRTAQLSPATVPNMPSFTSQDSLFEMRKGVTPVTMDMMAKGEVCGACHNGDQAFDDNFVNCGRCHRVPED